MDEKELEHIESLREAKRRKIHHEHHQRQQEDKKDDNELSEPRERPDSPSTRGVYNQINDQWMDVVGENVEMMLETNNRFGHDDGKQSLQGFTAAITNGYEQHTNNVALQREFTREEILFLWLEGLLPTYFFSRDIFPDINGRYEDDDPNSLWLPGFHDLFDANQGQFRGEIRTYRDIYRRATERINAVSRARAAVRALEEQKVLTTLTAGTSVLAPVVRQVTHHQSDTQMGGSNQNVPFERSDIRRANRLSDAVYHTLRQARTRVHSEL